MELNEFIEKFAEELEETSINELSGETKFKALEEWSSLTALSIISMVDEEYDLAITGADLRSSSTIEELYKLVESK
jgi:acyl carrier protein